MPWGAVVDVHPSRLGTVQREFDFAKLAGLHERECLRALGICVQRIKAVGSSTLVDIGIDASGRHHGVNARGFHDPESLCILFGCKAADLSGTCTTPGVQHRYVDLWPTVPGRVLSSADRPAAILRLEEAIWCRKWDLWCWEQAQVATEPSLEASLAFIPAGTRENQKKSMGQQIKTGILYPVVGALKQGLTESAAAAVASAFATEFISKAPSRPFPDALNDASAAARSERTTLLANGVVRPVGSWDELSDSTPAGKWHHFVTERQMHYGTNPIGNFDGKSTFEGCLAMIAALMACLLCLANKSTEFNARFAQSKHAQVRLR
jgi:hypothetical protein